MGLEIEHKFLVDQVRWEAVEKPQPSLIVQSYLAASENISVRIRIKGNQAFLTIKGKTEGISRQEHEYEIPVADAEEMINGFDLKQIRKLRYEIPVGAHTWEVDVFEGKLSGLVLAEVELSSEDEVFERPEWITEDVSTDPAYFNAVLINKC